MNWEFINGQLSDELAPEIDFLCVCFVCVCVCVCVCVGGVGGLGPVCLSV